VEQHHIDETRLVTRRSARDQIHLAWNHECAYCGDPLGRSPTLDHVVPKVHGGLTIRSNLVSCCFMCNSQKGHKPWVDWFRAQPFWSPLREWAIAEWITSHSEHREPDGGHQHAA
jgi:5-methylcytosine-specific restriction endonuclease McrA